MREVAGVVVGDGLFLAGLVERCEVTELVEVGGDVDDLVAKIIGFFFKGGAFEDEVIFV